MDRTGKEVNSRGLTLVEILAHATHYNANMRKECLAGIRDFFELHPTLVSLHIGAVRQEQVSACLQKSILPTPSATDLFAMRVVGHGFQSLHLM